MWFLQGMLNAYIHTQDARYLRVTVKNVEHLLQGAVTDAWGGLWYPYHFAHSPGKLDMGVPWVSGMAQGMVLSLLSRMYEVTGEQHYLDSAADTLKAFDVQPYEQEFWFSNRIDCPYSDFQCLIFEEYPALKPEQNAHVINGHMYAMFGLYDYYRVTGDEHAKALFNAGANAQRQLFEQFRRPEKPAWYAATTFGHTTWAAPESYHEAVIIELRELAEYTGDEEFARQADVLAADYHSQ